MQVRQEILDKINTSHPSQVVLMGMKITDKEIGEIINQIKKIRPDITSIFLNNNNISDAGAVILSKKLPLLFPNLKSIDLQNNQIGNTGAKELLTLKNTNKELDIALHGNQMINTGRVANLEQPPRFNR